MHAIKAKRTNWWFIRILACESLCDTVLHDQDIPAQGPESLFRERKHGGDSSCPCPAISRHVAASERNEQRPRHEPAGLGLAPAEGARTQRTFSVWVSGNWRMTFTFDGTDAVLVDYQDYH